MHLLSNFIQSLWKQAMERNISNIISMLEKNDKAIVLDVGCSNGYVTMKYKQKISCNKIVGIEGDKVRVIAAKRIGVDRVVTVDLEKRWPFSAASFDVLISNQVVEHIVNIDHFIGECYRVLRPNGYCVISTENLASWHNIGALVLGYQDFSHTLISKKHVGNPFALHYGKKTGDVEGKMSSQSDDLFYPHIKIPTYKSLIEIFKVFNFTFEVGRGSGYYPLFGFVGRGFSRIDPYHSHFITIKIRKPIKVSYYS